MISDILVALSNIWSVFSNTLQTLSLALHYLLSSVKNTLSLVPYLPPVIGAALVITISVFVVRFLLLK